LALLSFPSAAGAAVLLTAFGAWPALAQTVTQEEALRQAFPDAESVERRTAFLSAEQTARARQLAGRGVEVESELVTYYVAVNDGTPTAVAYFDAHRVRTLPEVLMVVVGTDHRVRRVQVLRFSEPPEYRPPEGWLARFLGLALGGEGSPRVDGITGATLTTRAVNAALRRTLALHAVTEPFRAVQR